MASEQDLARVESKTRFARTISPVGKLLLVGDILGEGKLVLRGIYFDGAPHAARALSERARAHSERAQEDARAFASVLEQLDAYFQGKRTSFDIALAPRGTAFQREVWRALAAIPYGETTTYAAIARSIGKPHAVRAVGAANGRNPLSIVVPCHRVIGGDGTLTGYAGGIENKRRLLELESRLVDA
jgi:methylated-DNA-[protein]-cysteine S-methyltransferase